MVAGRTRRGNRRRPGPVLLVLLALALVGGVLTATRSAGVRTLLTADSSPGWTSAAPSATPSPPVSASSPVHRVVGLGDSVPAGTHCDCTDFVHLVAADVGTAQGSSADATDLAVGGQTSTGLLGQLDDQGVAAAVADADVVLVTIGANDFDSGTVTDDGCDEPADGRCYQSNLAQLTTTMGQLLDRVHALTTARVVVTGYWNVFLDGSVGRAQGPAYVRNSDALTKAVNAELRDAAASHGAVFVDLYAPFKGDGSSDDTPLLAADGDHPNAQGHAVIAQAITTALTSSS